MTLPNIAGIVTIVGSIIFLVAAFLPISMTYFPAKTVAERLEIVTTRPQGWLIAQLLFGLGGVVTAVGLGLAASHWEAVSWALSMGWGLFGLGAGLWAWLVYWRAKEPAGFAQNNQPNWPFPVYSFLTQAGLLLFGIGLLALELPNWIGWLLIGGAILFCLAFIIFKDVPPLVYYILTLIAGIMIYGS